MPRIYSSSAQITSITGLPAATGGTSVANIYDGNPDTYYQTTSGTLNFSTTFESTRVNNLYILAEGISTLTSYQSLPGNAGLVSGNQSFQSSGRNKQAIITTNEGTALPIISTRIQLAPSSGTIRIYDILQMRHLEDLSQTENRSITRYESGRETRNAYVIEALDGTRSLQTGSIKKAKRNINYTIWENSFNPANLIGARNRLNDFYDLVRENPNFIIWDLDESNSQDYQGVFPAYWIPNSFSDRIEGQQTISYSFGIGEQ